jgi:uncharacterized protein DUF4242
MGSPILREATMSVWMVERELGGISAEALAAAQAGAIAESGKSTVAGRPVRYLRSLFTPGDGRCCCLFEAADAAAVRQVNDAAKLPYTRIVEALDLPPPG